MTNFQFTIALMVFLIAYALFEVPSNYMLKRLKPSNWIAFLMLSWGAITMGLGGVQNFGSVTAVRFLLGVFEAGLFPGLVCKCRCHRERAVFVSNPHRLLDLLVSYGRAFDQSCSDSSVSNTRRRLWWYVIHLQYSVALPLTYHRSYRLWRWSHEWHFRTKCLEMAIHSRRTTISAFSSSCIFLPARLSRDLQLAYR